MGLPSFLSLPVTISSQMEADSAPDSLSFVAVETTVTVRSNGVDVVRCVGDRMVSSEIEAAEALADLAHSAARQVNKVDEWSRTGSLPSKEGDTSLSMLMSSRKDAATLTFEQHYLNEDSSSKVRTKNDGKVVKLPKSNVLRPTTISPYLSVGKSRQNLNEEEKEARRLCRVLANRESARETIRRRQAHFEELMKKATSLAWENEDLQKEKELVIQEYDNLKKINESFKAQIARWGNVEETNVKPKSTPPEASTSQPACHPPFLYNQLASFWSPLIQLPNGSQNVSSEQENDLLAKCPGIALLCVYPCSWFMPRTDHDDPLHLWPSNDPSPFTKTTENHDHPHPLSMRLESVTCRKMAKEGGQNTGFETEEEVPMPSQRYKSSDCSKSKKQTVSSALINGKKRSEATAAAAEARKRRKELIKLKNQHYKRFRINC